MSTARDKFEKFLGGSPSYSTCCGRYVNHEVNERWKVWQHQQKIIDELERRAESDRVRRFEDAWVGRVVPMLIGIRIQRDPYLPERYMILSSDLFEKINSAEVKP